MALRGPSPPPGKLSTPGADFVHSQTCDGVAAVPRRICSFPLVELLRQGDTCPRPWQPGNTAADEEGATGSGIAEPGGEEGCYAICVVRRITLKSCHGVMEISMAGRIL